MVSLFLANASGVAFLGVASEVLVVDVVTVVVDIVVGDVVFLVVFSAEAVAVEAVDGDESTPKVGASFRDITLA